MPQAPHPFSSVAAPAQSSGSSFGSVFSTIGKGLLGMTGIGMIPLGIMEYQKRQGQQERSAQALGAATSGLSEAFSQAGGDPIAEHQAILQSVREVMQNPEIMSDDPQFIDKLLARAQQLQSPQSQQAQHVKLGPGDVLAEIPPGGGSATPLLAAPRTPTLLDEKIQLYTQVLGKSVEEATKLAGGLIDVYQVTDPFTQQSFPVLMDKTTGKAQVAGGQLAGTPVSPEQLQQLVDSGQAEGPTSAATFMAPLEQTESMTGAEASALGTGAASAAARSLANAASSFFIDGVQDQTLLDAQAAINDLKILGSAYVRDETGSARLAGVKELEAVSALIPKTDWGVSREENITNLIRLRSRLENDLESYDEALRKPGEHSPQFRRDIEGRVETANRMLARVGSREQLAQAREYIRTHPMETERIADVVRKALGHGPESVARARQELSRVGAGATETAEGIPEEAFRAIMAREDLATLSDEEVGQLGLEQMSTVQRQQLLARVQQLQEAAGQGQ